MASGRGHRVEPRSGERARASGTRISHGPVNSRGTLCVQGRRARC
ncbi:hypothetical protein AKJ09_03424 [Labilithrix luteola]|uniref:Uncharacterized protein n=1 Tax=Labilithrix luteola TaxID=1391654 RepID=A0A0K1PTA0_9BACT|nr:hypothetical protein AKJ09_03424 [Labilithrix luteola]